MRDTDKVTSAIPPVRFACPACGGPAALAIAQRLVLPGDRRTDEIGLEILVCSCGFKAIAVTEQLRRPTLRQLVSDRAGYRLPAAAVDLIAFLISRCPEPAEEFCSCPSHAALNRRDLRNTWNLLHSFAPFPALPLSPQTVAGTPAGAQPKPVEIEWERRADSYRATIEGRRWHLRRREEEDGLSFELRVGDALELPLPAIPPFWRFPAAESVR